MSKNGYIMRSEMDGSNIATIVSSLSYPKGLVVDYSEGRLYWTDSGNDNIRSSNLQGSDQRGVASVTDPWGIAILNDRVLFSSTSSDTVYSVTKAGTGTMTLHTGPGDIYQLVFAAYNLPQNRTNPCDSLTCSRLCVLKASSATCIF